MSKVTTATNELEHLAHAIKTNLSKSDNMYITAGQHMLKAKELCKAEGIKWGDWLKANDIGPSKASICLQIATNKKTVDEVRKDNAERQKKHKDTLKKKAAKADPVEDSDEDGDEDEGITSEHAALIRAITKFVKVAPPATLKKMALVFKISA